MGLILNIETSSKICSVALAGDGNILSIKESTDGYTHSENITLFINDVLKKAKVPIASLNAVAVSKGPGSYTGLRIGVSTAKGICFALGKPLIGISTLKSMTCGAILNYYRPPLTIHHSPLTTLFCPMIDARRMEVYSALLDIGGVQVRETVAEIINGESFGDYFKNNEIIFFGDGAEKCKNIFSSNPRAVFLDDFYISASSMVSLSEDAFKRNKFENLAYFEPFYLKDFVAGKPKSHFVTNDT